MHATVSAHLPFNAFTSYKTFFLKAPGGGSGGPDISRQALSSRDPARGRSESPQTSSELRPSEVKRFRVAAALKRTREGRGNSDFSKRDIVHRSIKPGFERCSCCDPPVAWHQNFRFCLIHLFCAHYILFLIGYHDFKPAQSGSSISTSKVATHCSREPGFPIKVW